MTRTLHPALRPYVVRCVGFDLRPPTDSVHYGLPSTTITVILSFDEPLDCGWLHQPGSSRYWMLVAGLHDGPSLIRTHGFQRGIQLALTPAGARALLGVPASALGNSLVLPSDSAAVGQTISADLHEHLAESDWESRFAVLEQHLLQRVSRTHHTTSLAPEIAEAWRLTLASRGRIPVAQVAQQVGWSRRHLQSRWGNEFGLSPKKVAKIARFDHAQRLQDAGLPLVDVAEQAGYADQSHLNRDWRALAGRTPVQAAVEFPIVLDDPRDPRASSRA